MKLTQEQIQDEINKAVKIAMDSMDCHGHRINVADQKNEAENFSPIFTPETLCHASADAIIEGVKNALEDEMWGDELGLRVERKEREAGDITTDTSKHISDLGRDTPFPEFEDADYEDLEDLGGLSAYKESEWNDLPLNIDGKHGYLMFSSDQAQNNDPDEGEVLLVNPVVLVAFC